MIRPLYARSVINAVPILNGLYGSADTITPMRQPRRAILHVDMDAFFASVEQLDHPEWRGRPLLVGYDGPRGVVTAASYEARPFGCRSAQPMAVAKRLCPQAIIAPVRFDRYREMSRQVFEVFERFTPLVEPLSVDEAFLDVTGSEPLFGSAQTIAERIKREVRERTALTASVGVAPNKFLAKLASDLNKPDGLTVIAEDDVNRMLDPLPIEKIWGIGPKTAERIQGLGVRTIGQLRAISPDVLRLRIGDEAEHYQRLAAGVDDRPVTPDRDAKSIGQEQTFGHDLADPAAIRAVMLEQVEQVGSRLRRYGLRARTVTVKIRFGEFQTITRRTTLAEPADTTAAIWSAARGLFDHWAEREFRPVRLIGVTAGNFAGDDGQLQLFGDPAGEKQRKVDGVVDDIHRKFGRAAIRRAGAEGPRERHDGLPRGGGASGGEDGR
jgi:DNA polymerase IV